MESKTGSIFTVSFNPSLSASMKAFIRINVSTEMSNNDSEQFEIDNVNNTINEFDKSEFLEEDLQLMEYLTQKVHFIELLKQKEI